jgi:hypothetical protein
LRQFGWVLASVLALAVWRQPSGTLQIVGQSSAGMLFAVSSVWPQALHPVYYLLLMLTFPIRWAAGYVLPGAVFFGVLTPLAFVLRLGGRHALPRGFDATAATYWQPCSRRSDFSQYYRQF